MALKLAFIFLVVAAALFLAGGAYLLFWVVLPSPQVPSWAKTGFAAATLGLLLLLLAVVRDRLRAPRRESLKKVEE